MAKLVLFDVRVLKNGDLGFNIRATWEGFGEVTVTGWRYRSGQRCLPPAYHAGRWLPTVLLDEVQEKRLQHLAVKAGQRIGWQPRPDNHLLSSPIPTDDWGLVKRQPTTVLSVRDSMERIRALATSARDRARTLSD